MKKCIELSNVFVSYESKPVLRDMSLIVFESDFLLLCGPNGGGKTTLLKTIGRLLRPSAGVLTFYRAGLPIPFLSTGYLPQINAIDRRFPISVREIIASGLISERRPLHRLTATQQTRLDEVIARTGLTALHNRAVGELSGGELQRVLLARAIVSRPKVLLLDEPTTHVDAWFSACLRDILSELRGTTTIILATHDVNEMRPLSNGIVHIENGVMSHPDTSISLS
jgi:zinc transport system ATP-binding protein